MMIYLLLNQQDHKWGKILVSIIFQHREVSPFDSKVFVFRNDPCLKAVSSEGQIACSGMGAQYPVYWHLWGRNARPVFNAVVQHQAQLCHDNTSHEEQGCNPEMEQACVY